MQYDNNRKARTFRVADVQWKELKNLINCHKEGLRRKFGSKNGLLQNMIDYAISYLITDIRKDFVENLNEKN